MNGAVFYEHFKDTLKYLGLSWSEMDQADVSIAEGKFTMTAAGNSCTLVPLAMTKDDIKVAFAEAYHSGHQAGTVELRRLKASNAELLKALKGVMEYANYIEERFDSVAVHQARAVIANRELEKNK